MTTLHALNHSNHQESGYSPVRKKVSEAEYWKKYYNNPTVVYEWNNGYLEEKAMSDVLTISMYKWFLELLEHYLRTNHIAQSVLLEMGFRLILSGKKEVRRPDLGVVLHENPIPLLPHDRSYRGTFDLCVEVLSDSTEEIRKRDTVTKKKEYAQGGVKEYYILDSQRDRIQFYRLGKKGVYIPIKPVKGQIIKSKVLPGFQFRIEDLFTKPSPEEMISDKVYQRFVLPSYTEEKRARQAEKRARQAERRARQTAEEQARQAEKLARQVAEELARQTELTERRTERLTEKLRELGVDPDKI
jgi:Uma2 family endonuclease